MSDFEERFSGIARLYAADGLHRLRQAQVCVVGIGGVGSWAAEALARSGVGALTLVDLDEVCLSNVNRQLHALEGTVGQPKVELMAERARRINPDCRVTAIQEFFTEANAEGLLTPRFDCVVDAIDGVSNKAKLIALCGSKKIPLIVSGGAAGRRDATRVRIGDLSEVTHDRLLCEVRRRLRQDHGWPRGGRRMGVECVFSTEPQVFPQADGLVCATRPQPEDGGSPHRNCDCGLGSATFVTGAFGFVAAGLAVKWIVEGR